MVSYIDTVYTFSFDIVTFLKSKSAIGIIGFYVIDIFTTLKIFEERCCPDINFQWTSLRLKN